MKSIMKLEESTWFDDSESDEEAIHPMCMVNQVKNVQECSEEIQHNYVLCNSSSYGFDNHPFNQVLKSNVQETYDLIVLSSLCNTTKAPPQEIEPCYISIEVSLV